MRMRIPDDSQVLADALTKLFYDRRPGEPLFDKLATLPTQHHTQTWIVQQEQGSIRPADEDRLAEQAAHHCPQ